MKHTVTRSNYYVKLQPVTINFSTECWHR